MQAATEYRDAWRGLSIRVPQGWRVSRSGRGLFLHDQTGEQTAIIQPRPGAATLDDLGEELLIWLRRLDDGAELEFERGGAAGTRACTACLHMRPDVSTVGVFALEVGPAGGLISGFLAPSVAYEAGSRAAIEALATLAPFAPLGRELWCEPSQGACSVLVPQGWQVEATISRSNPGGMATVSCHVWANEFTEVTAGTAYRTFIEPGLLSGILTGLARGLVGQGRFVDASHYAEAHLLPALRREAPDACIEEISPRPELIPLAIAQRLAPASGDAAAILESRPSGADVLFAFHLGGRQVQQLCRVVTMRVPQTTSHGLPMWMASSIYSYRAAGERLAEDEPILEGICQSFRLEPEWLKAEQARLAKGAGGIPWPDEAMGGGSSPLAQFERLARGRDGAPLAAHQRPFLSAPSDLACPVTGLYERSIWRGIGA